nr:hypothetical protein [Tanacetum cinerariifolium]
FLAVLPQVAAVVDIGRDGDAQPPGRCDGLGRSLSGGGRNSGRDARPVQPASIFQNLVPVKCGRVEAVAFGEEAVGGIDAVAAQVVGGGVAQLIGREGRYVGGRHAHLSQCGGYVGVATAVSYFEGVRLREPIIQRRREPHHYFAEGTACFSATRT